MHRGVYKMFKLNGNWTEEVIDDQEAHPFCDTDNQFLKCKIIKNHVNGFA